MFFIELVILILRVCNLINMCIDIISVIFLIILIFFYYSSFDIKMKTLSISSLVLETISCLFNRLKDFE